MGARARLLEQVRASSINEDLEPHDVGIEEYTSGRNVVFRDAFAERVQGVRDVFGDPIGPPVHLHPELTSAAAFWTYGTREATEKLGVTDGAAHFDITPAAGIVTDPTIPQPWTSGSLNGVPFYNWGSGTPVFWDLQTGNIAQDLPGWETDATCRAMGSFKNYLIAMDYTDGGGQRFAQLVRWSDAAEPGSLPQTWAPAPDNDAGSLSVAETVGPLIDGRTLRNQFILYKQRATHTLDFVGGTFIFALRTLFTTSGVLTRNCIQEFRGRHVVLTDGDVILTDGHSVQSIIDRRMRRFLFASIDPVFFVNSFVAQLASQNEIWVCYPENGSEFANRALVWDYEQNKWGVRDLFETPHARAGVIPDDGSGSVDWDTDTEEWDEDITIWNEVNFNPVEDSLLLADIEDGFFNVDFGIDFAGADIDAEIVRASLDLGEPDVVKTVRSIWPRVNGNSGDVVEIRLGTQMHINDAIEWSLPVEFRINVDEKVDVFGSGKLISYALRSIGGAGWQSSGFDIEYSRKGRY